jgi:membrane protease YdiL (CAAX protease family)
MTEGRLTPLNRRATLTYLIIALGFTWVCWLPALLWSGQHDLPLPTFTTLWTQEPFSFASSQHRWYSLLFTVAVYGPLLGGLVATYMSAGKAGLQGLLRRMFRWRIAGKWYVIILALALVIALVPFLVGFLIGAASFRDEPGAVTAMTVLLLLLFTTLTSGLGEEPGWRGYLLPSLQASFPQPKAIVILGVIWAVWHYPFTIYATLNGLEPGLGAAAAAVVIPALIGQTAALVGIVYIYVWLLNRTGSVFLLIIFHALTNVVPELFARLATLDPALQLLGAVMPWLIVLALERAMGKERFPGQANLADRGHETFTTGQTSLTELDA